MYGTTCAWWCIARDQADYAASANLWLCQYMDACEHWHTSSKRVSSVLRRASQSSSKSSSSYASLGACLCVVGVSTERLLGAAAEKGFPDEVTRGPPSFSLACLLTWTRPACVIACDGLTARVHAENATLLCHLTAYILTALLVSHIPFLYLCHACVSMTVMAAAQTDLCGTCSGKRFFKACQAGIDMLA